MVMFNPITKTGLKNVTYAAQSLHWIIANPYTSHYKLRPNCVPFKAAKNEQQNNEDYIRRVLDALFIGCGF